MLVQFTATFASVAIHSGAGSPDRTCLMCVNLSVPTGLGGTSDYPPNCILGFMLVSRQSHRHRRRQVSLIGFPTYGTLTNYSFRIAISHKHYDLQLLEELSAPVFENVDTICPPKPIYTGVLTSPVSIPAEYTASKMRLSVINNTICFTALLAIAARMTVAYECRVAKDSAKLQHVLEALKALNAMEEKTCPDPSNLPMRARAQGTVCTPVLSYRTVLISICGSQGASLPCLALATEVGELQERCTKFTNGALRVEGSHYIGELELEVNMTSTPWVD